MSMKKKILGLALLTAVVITAISGVGFYFFSRQVHRSEDAKIDIVKDQIENVVSQELSVISEILNYLSHDFIEKDEYLKEINISTTYENRLHYMIHQMNDLAKIEKTIKFLGYAGADKSKFLDSHAGDQNLPKDFDPTIRPWYVGALNTDGTYLSDVFTHIGTGDFVVTLSKKIEFNGKVVGVILALIDLSDLTNTISKFKIGKNGSFFIIDKNKNILADGGDNKELFSYISDEDFSSRDQFKIKKETPNGDVFFYVQKLKKLDITLIGSVYESDLNSNINALGYYLLITIFLTIALILDGLYYLNKSFKNSLNRLLYVINSIYEGNYTKNIDKITETIDEENELIFIKNAIKRMNSEIIKREDELKYISETDPLTRSFNRGAIIKSLEKELKQADLFNTQFCLIMFDLDKFKKVNDTFGHLFGDTVLKEICRTIDNSIKSTDILGRYGGEEFLVLLPNTKIENAISVAERLRVEVEALTWEFETTVTISIGVVENFPTDNINLLLERVDNLLYKAKNKGRNRIEHQKLVN